MNKKKVLVTCTNYRKYSMEACTLLVKSGFVIIDPVKEFPRLREEELLEIMPDIDAVVAGLDCWNERVFSVSKKLKVIARFGLGVDNIDLASAKKHGIYVTNARASFNAVAEIALSLILSCLRHTYRMDRTTKSGKWERLVGHQLDGKVVGMIGFGKIPQTLSRRLSGFDVKLLAYDLNPNYAAAEALHVEIVNLNTLLEQSDIVSLHLPAVPQTMNFMNDERFNQCKDGACFINTARGSLVDENALYCALTNGKIWAAGVDVFAQEPVNLDNPLLKLDNFSCSPHQGSETFQTMRDVGLIGAKAIIDTFDGRIPENLLNP